MFTRRCSATWGLVFLVLTCLLIATAPAQDSGGSPWSDSTSSRSTHPGEKVFNGLCAHCHLGQAPRAPHKTFLAMLSAEAIYEAQTQGIMRTQTASLTDQQKKDVAEYLTGRKLGAAAETVAAAPRCTGPAASFDMTRPASASAWGFALGNTHWIDSQTAGLTAADVPRLKVKWALGFPHALRARSQPSTAMGAVFVGSEDGTVYSLDAATGCIRWTYKASAEVRTPVVISPWVADQKSTAKPRAFFGDLVGHVYALDARTGALEWKVKPEDHSNATITGAPVLAGGKLFVPVSSLEVVAAIDPKYECCTFRGSVAALDAVTGKTVWKTYTIPDAPRKVGQTKAGTAVLAPSGAPVWNSPTVDAEHGLIYFGDGENYAPPANDTSDSVFALALDTGARKWVHQTTQGDAWNAACTAETRANCPEHSGPDLDFGAGTALVERTDGRSLVLAGQKSGWLFALDPLANGAKVWATRVGRGGLQGGIHFSFAAGEGRVIAPVSDTDDSFMGYHYKEPARPGLYALDLEDGHLLWSNSAAGLCGQRKNCEPGISAAITLIPGVVFAGHLNGLFRAYDAANGHVLWALDTTQSFHTLAGSSAHGGSIDGGGALVSNGMVYINSGYGTDNRLPGNVLLALSVDGK